MNVNSELKGISSIDNFETFLNEVTAKKVGLLGKRRFIHKNSKGTISLNNLVEKFWKIAKGSTDKQLLDIRDKIRKLDYEGYEKLQKKNWFTRVIMHWVVGNKTAVNLGFFRGTLSRNQALQAVCLQQRKTEVMCKYLAADVFDRFIKGVGDPKGKEAKDLKNAIVNFLSEQSKQNAEELMKCVPSFLSKITKKRHWYGETSTGGQHFLKKLIYNYRKGFRGVHIKNISIIRRELCSMLVAAYAVNEGWVREFDDKKGGAYNFTLYVGSEDLYHLRDEKDLQKNAEKIYSHYIDRNKIGNETIRWWKLS